MNIKRSRDRSLESTTWPVEISQTLNRTLLQLIPSQGQSRFLEVGTGSGRTTLSLLQSDLAHETQLVGVDISPEKLHRLLARARSSTLNLVQADASILPFPARSFDIILTIHVLHLIRNWGRTLLEFRRLLRPGGAYIRRRERRESITIWDRMRQQWQAILKTSNLPQQHGARHSQAIDDFLAKLGASHSPIHLGSASWESTPEQEIGRIAARTRTGTWQVPREILPQLLDDLRAWTITEYGSLERPYGCDEGVVLDIWRFQGAPAR